MRTSKPWQLFLISIAVYVSAPLAEAQEAAKDAPPPKLEVLGNTEDPDVTISKPDNERKVTEKRTQGKVTEVKVKSGKSTYYLKPNTPAGSVQPGEVQSDSVRPAQWKLLEFDLGKKKESDKESADPKSIPPAPPEPATVPAK